MRDRTRNERASAYRRFLFPGPTARELALALARVGSAGLVAVGASGALAWVMGSAFGKPFVAGDPSGVTYTPARCADLFEYAPGTRSCEQAAVLHHFGEIVIYRLAAGLLGVLVFLAYRWVRRRVASTPDALPEALEITMGATLYVGAAAVLLGTGLAQLAAGQTRGAGGLLSGGIAALAPAALFAIPLSRALLQRPDRS